jgi:hypothetical protein
VKGVRCKNLADKLLLFRDGDLGAAETEYLRTHLHDCPMCLELLRSYDELVTVLHRLQPVCLPAGLVDRLKARLREGV